MQAIHYMAKARKTHLWHSLKEDVIRSLISPSLCAVEGKSEVHYVDMALHFLVPLLPIMCFIVSILEK